MQRLCLTRFFWTAYRWQIVRDSQYAFSLSLATHQPPKLNSQRFIAPLWTPLYMDSSERTPEKPRGAIVQLVPGLARSWSQYKAHGFGESFIPHSTLEMLLHSVLLTLYALPALIRGKQIPMFDGAISGVPSPNSCKFKVPEGPVYDNAPPPRNPGKLRGVVENSGICGGSCCLWHMSCQIDSLGRNYPACLSGFRIR